jgi:Ca2+-transporting ATPase
MTTLHTGPDGVIAYSKGAPEVILETCTHQLTSDGEVPLDASSREAIIGIARRMAADALRILAVASRPGATLENAEHAMTFLGLVGMIDPRVRKPRRQYVRVRRPGFGR